MASGDDPSWTRWIVRLGAAALLAAFAAAWPYRLFGADADQVDRMVGELERTRAAIRERRSTIAELRRAIEALKEEPGAVEDIARRELGMVRPGELVLRFDPAEPPGGAP